MSEIEPSAPNPLAELNELAHQNALWPRHPAASLFPMLSEQELTELAEDIRANGLHEPVWLFEERGMTMLLDGRNRVRACEIAGVPIQTRRYTGSDPLGFVVSENIRRRHLSPGQLAFLGVEVEKRYAAQAELRQKAGGNQALLPVTQRSDLPADLPEGANSSKHRESRERAAKATGASGRAISQAKRVEQQAPDLAEQVKANKLALDRAERIIRNREAEQRRIAEARAEAAAQPEPTVVDIRVGDFREALSDLHDIDAIITDPPYERASLPLLADLATWADKVLAPNGVMAVLFGQAHLPAVYRLLDGGRPYRWTACYLTPGNTSYIAQHAKVQTGWKPLLVYGGGTRFADVVTSAGDVAAKDLHRWGQDFQAFYEIIRRLTAPGQTVADPFMGAGTTLLAANALGRHAVGCDIDPEAVQTARERFQ